MRCKTHAHVLVSVRTMLDRIINEFATDRRLDDQILRLLAIPVNDQGLIVSNALYEELYQPGAQAWIEGMRNWRGLNHGTLR